MTEHGDMRVAASSVLARLATPHMTEHGTERADPDADGAARGLYPT